MPTEETNVYRDGEVHIQSRKCDTCIYRPGNLMHLEPGRQERMQEEAVAEHGVIPCHKTLGSGREAICRGFWDVVIAKGLAPLLSMAKAMKIVAEDSEFLDRYPGEEKEESA